MTAKSATVLGSDITATDARRDNQTRFAAEPVAALERLAATLVEVSCVDVAQNRVKRAMLHEALARTRGNYTKAAFLLGVRRQAVQQMVIRYESQSWALTLRTENTILIRGEVDGRGRKELAKHQEVKWVWTDSEIAPFGRCKCEESG